MRDYIRMLDHNLKVFTDNPNPGDAEAIIAQIFFSGPLSAAGQRYKLDKIDGYDFTSADEQAAAKILEKIIALCPEVNLNCRLVPKYGKINYRDKDGFERLESESRGLPTILPTYAVVTGYDYEGCINVEYYYTPCTPLMLAALFDMPAVMKVLLKHPAIDVTVLTGEARNFDQKRSKVYKATAYALAPMLAFSCKKMLQEAAQKQFYREAITAEPNQTDALVQKYQDCGVKPKGVREFISKQIKESVESEEDLELKCVILKREFERINQESSLKTFLGDTEMTALKDEIDSLLGDIFNKERKVTKATATTAPTTTFTDSTDKGGGINTGEAGQSSRIASILSKFTRK